MSKQERLSSGCSLSDIEGKRIVVADDSDQHRAFLTAQSRARGMLLGLALGDTLGTAHGTPPAGGVLRAGVSTQLACFTAEGILRAMVRSSHKGICHPPSVVLHAYCRWAAVQGIETEKMRRHWAPSGNSTAWPDGWLAHVPALAERRGSAPATVTALSRIGEGPERMATPSRGWHALARTLPVAIAGMNGVAQAGEIAALTHGDAAARSATTRAAFLVHYLLTHPAVPNRPAPQAIRAALGRLPSAGLQLADEGHDSHDSLLAALQQALDQPGDARRLARLAPDATAPAALLGALYVTASFPARADVGAALGFAASAPYPDSVACVTGALLGAAHGVEALPVDLSSRHELAWVLDTLARDLLTEAATSPSGTAYTAAWDPTWLPRYPAW
ncbi:ADP-ribosylglycohydrolase family protein [Actinacidiphila sp. ITFR-21]|uniref:ADP-ribosylglycohydrolase family protein n=1 Tax=Actinacidiphila sp. ITFR-21 TaxID=3075199 RepID=UPI00288BA98D|nr:ADP-ribosylglycohydrolase family protein [Streptomyces sp. ITFR-21]WNI16351.1 ADP-ribosylglycohydrolase family protein [Streptomyces sp. ITFR-21]